MKEKIKNMLIKLQVSNVRSEDLMNNVIKANNLVATARNLLIRYKNLLAQELEISNDLANKLRLELLMDDAAKAQTGRR
ncbi:MAG: hypothetical protein NUV47_01210 [Patescibacteria group bacterium]|nr:hypothetical protein [Patescibacteria group bacterium]